MNFQLLSAIFRHPWAIQEQSAIGYAPLISNILTGSPVMIEGTDEKPIVIASKSPRAVSYYDMDMGDAPEGSVVVIHLNGPLMKNNQFCGPVGMAEIGKRIKEAGNNDNISAIILKIDSPGGTVDGTEALAEIVKNTQKPVISYVDGLMASAALWIGTAADEVIASTDTTEVGSVGVLLSFADMQPAYERMGVKFHQIISNHSSDKVKQFNDILKGDYDEYKKEVLDPLAEKFMQTVRDQRPGVKDEHLTGKVYFARDVVGAFVDKIGNWDYAVARAFELGNQFENSNNTDMSKKSENNEYTATMKVIGVESLESTKDGIHLNNDQLDAIEQALVEGSKAKSDLEEARQHLAALEEGQTIEGLQAEAQWAEGLDEGETVAGLKASLKAKDEEIEKLSKTPASEETTAETVADEASKTSDPQAEEYHRISKFINN